MFTERQKMFLAVTLFIGLSAGLIEQVGEMLRWW